MPDIRFVKRKEISPGKLYKKIETTPGLKAEKGVLKKKKENAFVLFCKKIYKLNPSFGKGAKFTDDFRKAVDFLDWNLKPEELTATVKFVLMLGVVFIAVFAALFFSVPFISKMLSAAVGPMAIVYVLVLPLIFLMAIVNYLNNYPLNAAKTEEKRALTYVPEIVGYLVMSLKLVPNLEKAVEFAAEHGKGKIADEFQKLLWEVQLGEYNTLAEGLDELAYRWGDYSSEFKQALMMLRASVLEDSEAKRYALLDKTMSDVLASIKEKMEKYARNLNQPTVMLFYLGILLPLILIIVLPIGSAFTASPLAQPLVLAAIYNLIIPLATFLFALNVIKGRPPTYIPPKITDDFPSLPKKWHFKLKKGSIDLRLIAIVILIAGVSFSLFISEKGVPPTFIVSGSPDAIEGIDFFPQILSPDKSVINVLESEGVCSGEECLTYFEENGKKWQLICAETNNCLTDKDKEKARAKLAIERTKFFSKKETDITPYNLVFGLLLTLGLIFYFVLKYMNHYKRKAQLDIMDLESEFRDSLYVIASRMGENRPVEDALDYTRKFLPKYKISRRIYGRILENIKLLGLPLEEAIFNKKYGALVNIPSTILIGGMRILVDSVRLGVNVGARTLVSLSLQLENSEKVNTLMKTLLSDITVMMNTMTAFIAPIILGITVTMQKIVVLTLASIISSGVSQQTTTIESSLAGSNIPLAGVVQQPTSLFSEQAFLTIASPLQFLLIIAVYVLEITIILTYFTTKIEEDNEILFKLNLARNLPISMIMFILAVILSNIVVGSFGG